MEPIKVFDFADTLEDDPFGLDISNIDEHSPRKMKINLPLITVQNDAAPSGDVVKDTLQIPKYSFRAPTVNNQSELKTIVIHDSAHESDASKQVCMSLK